MSLEVHQASLNFPKIEQYALADQLRRSSKSVCAKYSRRICQTGINDRV
ncbi:four helix bundle protein [Lonepinella sp. BR2271]